MIHSTNVQRGLTSFNEIQNSIPIPVFLYIKTLASEFYK